MIIAVASGKGGTGKTTVAVNLAFSIASQRPSVKASKHQSDKRAEALGRYDAKMLFLDCDVEEPNAHLFLNPTIERREEVGILIPEVDYSKCTFCGRCAEVCAYHAIAVVKQQVLIFPELCHGCGSCTLNCPEKAIHEVLKVTGVIEEGWALAQPQSSKLKAQTGQARIIRFAHGILNIGEPMAVPVIRQLKKRIGEADLHPHSMVILDASPGTACPVVETMRGADFVLMVTEPTPFGLHDLKLAVEVARDELGLPVGVVINRDGVGDRGVEDYCAAEGIPILMRIPLDRRIAEAYSEGVVMVEALPEYRERLVKLYRRIAEEAR
ncbi:MAG: (4Fe-4S)-binding protein [Chloroflexi bacterium]|nr:(4Fe-4S)-binding protein [Chloroflexota bacterium]